MCEGISRQALAPSLTGAAQTCTETSRQILSSAALCCVPMGQCKKVFGVGRRMVHFKLTSR
ncbi:hypothetical protein MGG_17417 [Pyricularia oryzae 70-15]|uniref:Uncharacterized protein n=3 Tax=Pyricularia oryzae TaxID=318829 RepID=G4NBA1_PYRO7|nr:uncharacterized protein MGG_17417 [Pyricularia oryzae 70-15]EHA48863.1 hypothetical protein MGG_17417 [Pyricularia oryzae 70-15]ELQ38764.1 hypothetical protein OOU_Y34scaffold00528g56 [Pyricularia oryzae Y34]